MNILFEYSTFSIVFSNFLFIHISICVQKANSISSLKKVVIKPELFKSLKKSPSFVQTSSGPIERTFSYAGYINRPHRSRMTLSLITKSRLTFFGDFCTSLVLYQKIIILKVFDSDFSKKKRPDLDLT
ncbi:hypothetical protein BpHYR1_043095 [Brachionus plicatilis]|uniref:HAT C-terminal dimerisation domain-containing protein n=1 Tax=Brachionus plicatilis TaxID=10195 RepID=A0A3M7T272_BRAPC|nr:hypothetical protein BpHYR1_043095 [Brachionus plicatilis]